MDHLVTRGVPAPGNVGIDRYLSGGTGSRGYAYQVYGGAAALFLNVLDRLFAQIYLHKTASTSIGWRVSRAYTTPLIDLMRTGGQEMQTGGQKMQTGWEFSGNQFGKIIRALPRIDMP